MCPPPLVHSSAVASPVSPPLQPSAVEPDSLTWQQSARIRFCLVNRVRDPRAGKRSTDGQHVMPMPETCGAGSRLHPRCFGQVWIFEGIPPEAWESLAGDLVRRRLSAGEDLFQQGEPAESMWLIKAGSVKLWKTTEDGRS